MKDSKDSEKNRLLFGANTQNLVALVKASPLGIIAIDLDGTILLWNRAAEEITGWREEELLGLRCVLAATLADFLNATIAGALFEG